MLTPGTSGRGSRVEVQLHRGSGELSPRGGGGMVGTEPASPEAQGLALLGLVRETSPSPLSLCSAL